MSKKVAIIETTVKGKHYKRLRYITNEKFTAVKKQIQYLDKCLNSK